MISWLEVLSGIYIGYIVAGLFAATSVRKGVESGAERPPGRIPWRKTCGCFKHCGFLPMNMHIIVYLL